MRPNGRNVEFTADDLEAKFAVETRGFGAGVAPETRAAVNGDTLKTGFDECDAETPAAHFGQCGHTAETPRAVVRFTGRGFAINRGNAGQTPFCVGAEVDGVSVLIAGEDSLSGGASRTQHDGPNGVSVGRRNRLDDGTATAGWFVWHQQQGVLHAGWCQEVYNGGDRSGSVRRVAAPERVDYNLRVAASLFGSTEGRETAVARSSRGLGHQILILKIRGSNPLRATIAHISCEPLRAGLRAGPT